MKVERILTENDLLPQKAAITSKKKVANVLTEDAVTFEGKEEKRRENSGQQHLSYSPKNKGLLSDEANNTESKEDLDVVA